jgi:hypothetical protein
MASQATDVGSRPPRDWFRYLPLLIPLATVLVIIVTVVTWQSPSEAYTEDACDGLRNAEQGLAEGDRTAVADGARSMGALDPAGEDPDANRADLQKLWAAASAFARVLNEWDEGTAAPQAAADRRLITTGVEVCQAYDSPWFAPQRLLRD